MFLSASFVLVADGQFLSEEILQHGIGVDKRVIVSLDGATEKLLQLKIIPDVVLGDFDSIDPLLLTQLRSNHAVKVVNAPDQNFTDLQKGVLFCKEQGAERIDIVCALGGRLDHTMMNFNILAEAFDPKIEICLHDEQQSIFFVKDESLEILSDTGTGYCGIFGFPVAKVRSKGLLYENQDYVLSLGKMQSACNQFNAKRIQVDIEGDALFVVPSLLLNDIKIQRKGI